MPKKGSPSNNPLGRTKTGQRKEYIGVYLTPQDIQRKTGIEDIKQAKAKLREIIQDILNGL